MDGLEDLERWAADARARAAADARVRERWLRAQAEEEASLAGALLACAEREETVVLTGVDGHRHRGIVAGVGVDFCAVIAPGGTTSLVALDALAQVRPVDPTGRRRAAAAGHGHGHGRASLGVRLADVLAQAAGQRPRISLHAGTASVVGELQAVGSDVATVRTDGDGGVVYVRLASVSDVSFLASG